MMLAYDAIVFEPVMLHMARMPRVHAVVGPGVALYIQMDPHAAVVPETVYAVGFADDVAYFGTIPTANIGIGPLNSSVKFTDAEGVEQ